MDELLGADVRVLLYQGQFDWLLVRFFHNFPFYRSRFRGKRSRSGLNSLVLSYSSPTEALECLYAAILSSGRMAMSPTQPGLRASRGLTWPPSLRASAECGAAVMERSRAIGRAMQTWNRWGKGSRPFNCMLLQSMPACSCRNRPFERLVESQGRVPWLGKVRGMW